MQGFIKRTDSFSDDYHPITVSITEFDFLKKRGRTCETKWASDWAN